MTVQVRNKWGVIWRHFNFYVIYTLEIRMSYENIDTCSVFSFALMKLQA